MFSRERLIILDADGTTIDAFGAITKAFAVHGMDIGDLTRFQKRRHLFIVSYGFEDYERLTTKIGVPPELISRAPDERTARVLNALDLAA